MLTTYFIALLLDIFILQYLDRITGNNFVLLFLLLVYSPFFL